ncbi:Coiled-coil domain-containing protein [Trichinella pseudospiralis]|uniref:Coiled-coil domain-containing protein n=1 Tax=Trichinella pseudospiralis TaxID=6337 RepID=A0A0V1ETH0_TRIPS|nr:Coiled-coil domain-containing protein [Trichinella pseudospiralis]KRZ29318.1 Coiled-coil domain-containing protein [Trichinella pseudospiralis]KRZ42515.1 Coiled-coil domain-containing protein [Trichinella pseudospiralis]
MPLKNVFKFLQPKTSSTLLHSRQCQRKHLENNVPPARRNFAVPLAQSETFTDNEYSENKEQQHQQPLQKQQQRGIWKKSNLLKYNNKADDEDEGIMSEVETSCTTGMRSKRNSRCRTSSGTYTNMLVNPYGAYNGVGCDSRQVFLQFKDETKRATLPDDLRYLDDIRELFLHTFSDSISRDYVTSSFVKIYIQNPGKEGLFYELDDLSDINEGSILKLHEQSRGIPADGSEHGVTFAADHRESLSTPTALTVFQSSNPLSSSPYCTGIKKEMRSNYYSESELEGDYRLRKSSSMGMYNFGIEGYNNNRFGSNISAAYRNPMSRYGASKAAPPNLVRKYVSSTINLSKPDVYLREDCLPPAMILQNRRPSPFGHSGTLPNKPGILNYPYSEKSCSSDRSDSLSRSGSVTPIIDEETKVRMFNMEKQLTNLSNLVHSALVGKGVQDAVCKDWDMLRRELVNGGRDDTSDSGSTSRFSDIGSDKLCTISHEKDKIFSEGNNNLEKSKAAAYMTCSGKRMLKSAHQNVQKLQREIRELKKMAETNNTYAKNLVRDMSERIKVILNTNKHIQVFAEEARKQRAVQQNALLTERNWADQEERRFQETRKCLENKLINLEEDIDKLREQVVTGRRKLKMSDVEYFTETLMQIARTAAALKSDFPVLEDRLKWLMSSEMEKVVREEKFLKEEPFRINAALKRCKKLTNTILTMKRLAQVQDSPPKARNYQFIKSTYSPLRDSSTKFGLNPMPDNTSFDTTVTNKFNDEAKKVLPTSVINGTLKKSNPVNSVQDTQKTSSFNGDVHVLDSLLEELQTVAHDSATSTLGRSSNAEKRVGFIDQVKHFPTVKDELSGTHPAVNASENGLASGNGGGGGGTEGKEESSSKWGWFSNVVKNETLKKVASPSRFFRHHVDENRSRSATPMSVSSEPGARMKQSSVPPPPPPPPPRTSSKNILFEHNASPDSDVERRETYEELRQQYRLSNTARGQPLSHSLSSSSVPTQLQSQPIIHTSAVDEEPPRFSKSASSSESINSQDGALNFKMKPPPPPPPPRDRIASLKQQNFDNFLTNNPQTSRWDTMTR